MPLALYRRERARKRARRRRQARERRARRRASRSGGGAGQEVAAQFLLFALSTGAGHDPAGPPGGGAGHLFPAPAASCTHM